MQPTLRMSRSNPATPRPSLRDRFATLKGSAAKVIGKGQARHRWPRLAGGGEPSKAMSDLIIAHQLAYARCLHGMGEEGADMAALRATEEEAFRALLHAPLTSDADRGCYAAAVIERENGFLVRGYAGTRNDPLSVAYRNLRFGDHAREPEETQLVGHPAEPETAADPILSAIEKQRRLYREHDALFAQLGEHWDSSPVRPAEQAAHAAMWEHWREVVLKTVPRTASGCQALAAYALEFLKEQGTDLDEEGPMILDLIARSPLVKPAASADAPIPGRMVDAAPAEAQGTASARMSDDPGSGLIIYVDASGKLSRKPVDQVLSFMAMRLRGVAHTELSRRFNAECKGLDEAGCRELEDRLRRELRLDALDILVHRHDEAFAAAQAKRDGVDLVKMSAEQIDLSRLDVFQLSALFEAFQIAKFSWEGVMARPYSFEGRPGRSETTALGEVAGFEEERASWIIHRLEEEIAKRTPEDEEQRDEILMVRTQQEFRCNARIHDNSLLLDISRAWIV